MSEKPKKRIVNFRSFLITAVLLVISIFIALVLYNDLFAGIILASFFFLMLLFFVIYYIRKRDFSHRFLTFALSLVLSIVSFTVFLASVYNWTPGWFENKHPYTVSGVIDFNGVSNDQRTVVLKNVIIDGEKVSGKLQIFIDETNGAFNYARTGDSISFNSAVTAKKFIDGFSVNGTIMRKNIRYYSSVKDSELAISFGSPGFLDKVRNKISELLYGNLSEDNAAVAYSMITGDKNNLSPDITNYFSASGLGHIMAVSGLHVGFITAALIWLLRKLRLNKTIIFILTFLTLLLYAALAGFSVSVIRASIMSLIGLFTMINGQRKDILNSLCCAVTLILVIMPYSLFDVGFLMSVCAVLGIVLFDPPIEALFSKLRFPKFLRAAIGLPIAVQVGILPVMVYYFKNISVYSIFANILMMPLIQITFTGMIISVLITAVMPFMGFLVKFFGFGLDAINITARFTSGLPFSTIVMFASALIFICYIFYFVSSRFVMAGKKKWIVTLAALLLCAVITGTGNISYGLNASVTPVATNMYDVTSIITNGGNTYVIGDMSSHYDVKNTLIDLRVRKVNAVFLNRLTEKTAQAAVELSKFYKGFDVYFPLEESMTGLSTLTNAGLISLGFGFDKELTAGIFSEYYEAHTLYQGFMCYRLTFGSKNTLLLGIRADYDKLPQTMLFNAHILRSFDFSGEGGQMFVRDGAGSERIYSDLNYHSVYDYKNSGIRKIKRQ